MNFPVFSQLAGNFRVSETGSLQTASSSKEYANHRFPRRCGRSKFVRYAKGQPGVAFLRKDEIARYALESQLTLREGETI